MRTGQWVLMRMSKPNIQVYPSRKVGSVTEANVDDSEIVEKFQHLLPVTHGAVCCFNLADLFELLTVYGRQKFRKRYSITRKEDEDEESMRGFLFLHIYVC